LNFVGKFDAKLPVDGPGAHFDAHTHVGSLSNHAPSDAIIVPDADLLFKGDFKRAGVDLVLSRDDHELVLHDYFKGEKRAALSSPDGAHLTGDIVNALTGHVDYAQADGSTSAGKVIGHVTKLAGTATAIRNGVSITLNLGDNVEKGDVVQSGSSSTLGVTFIDGTVFGLASNARMVLNEMVYDPNGSDNSTLFSLVAGTISFVAGQTAKHGDMKIDTPVATMGIRGTAVLVEIDFDTPGQSGTPEAKFQVLMEPDGTTGSYLLFEKNTLTQIAQVNVAGQQVSISNNNVSYLNSPLTPELQQLISDVFAQKSTDANTKSFVHFTDSLLPQTTTTISLPGGVTATEFFVLVNPPEKSAPLAASDSSVAPHHIDLPPTVVANSKSLTELPHVTGSHTHDTVSGTISFADINGGDLPTAKATFGSFTYQNAQHQDITATLTAPQNADMLADIKAVEIPLVVTQTPGNDNKGTATWIYTIADKAFDFLAAGETLTLTYLVKVDSNFTQDNLSTTVPFTITITGTNDAPVITTGPETVSFINVGTSTPGPHLPPAAPTTNTLAFTDPDLTDTHTVSAGLTNATLSGPGVATLDMDALETKFPRPMGVFETALTAAVTKDSSGTGTGTITWTLADISAFYADIVPTGETLTLTYTVTVEDSHGATSSQAVTVTVIGSNPPVIDWVETTATASTDAAPGDWNGANNWETGTVPTATDAVVITTNQLQGSIPFFPVTIKAGAAAAFALSLTMEDFDNTPAELDIGRVLTPADVANGIANGALTISGELSLSDDSILRNFGTLSVGTIAEILDSSVLQNSGLMTLGQGGDFEDSSSITNSGTIEIAGGTLDVEVAVANSGGTIQIDGPATLRLNGAAINGGTVTDNGKIDVTGNSKIDGGATLKNGTATVESGVTLTLDGVTVNGTTVTDKGTIVLADTVKLTGGAIIEGVSSSVLGAITNNGTLEVTGAAKLLDDTLTNTSGVIQVDALQTLTLSGTEIIGGTINDNSKIDVTGDSTIDGGASLHNGAVTVESGVTLTLDGVTVNGTAITGEGMIDVTGDSTVDDAATLGNSAATVESGVTLTLDGMTVNGTTITDKGTIVLADTVKLTGNATIEGASGSALGAITNNGTLEIAGVAELLDDKLTNNSSIQIDDSQTLTLSGTTITGGVINDFSGAAGGTIDVTGDSTIDGGAALNNGAVMIGSGVTLTLDAVTVNGTGTTGEGKIDVTGDSTIDGGASLHNGAVTVESGVTLTLDAVTVNGTAITGEGMIDVTGDSTVDDAATLGNSAATVESGVTLTLDGMTVSGTTVTDKGTIVLADTVKLTGNATIEGASGSALGAITNNGTLEIAGAATLLDDKLTNTSGIIQVDALQTLTLSGTEIIGGTITDNSKIDVTGSSKIDGGATLNKGAATVESGVTLTLDGMTVNGTTVTDTGTIVLDDTVKLTGGATIERASGSALGTITNNGTLEVTGTAELLDDTLINTSGIIQVDALQTLTLSGTTIIGGTITGNSTIDVTGNSKIDGTTAGAPPVTTNAVLNGGAATVESGVTLTLDNVTVSATTITDKGTIVLADTVKLIGGATLEGASGSALGAITNNGTLEIAGAAELLDDTLTNTSATGSIIQIDDNQTLTLSGTTIIGGIINNFSGPLGGTIRVTGDSTIDGGATLHNGAVMIGSGVTLTLDAVTVNGTGTTGEGTIDVTGDSTIDGGATLHNGAVTVESGVTLTLDNVTVNGTAITGEGTIDVTGDSTIDGSATLGNSAATVESGVTLTLDDMTTVNGTTITDKGTIVLDGTVKLTGGATLEGVSRSALGAITNNGTLEIAGAATLLNDTLTNTSGIIHVDALQTLTLSGTTITSGMLTIDGTLDSTGISTITGASITNTGLIDSTSGVLTIDSATLLTLINSGTLEATSIGTLQIDDSVNNTGTLAANGGTLIIEANAVISGTASVTIEHGGTADFVGSSTQELVLNAVFSTAGGTLELDNSQHYNGTISGFGSGDTIKLTDLTFSATETDVWNSATDMLTITNGSQIESLKFAGTFTQSDFALTQDGNHTDVVSSPATASLTGLDSSNNAVDGHEVTATLTDANATGVTYQWLDNGMAIANATGASFTPVDGELNDKLDVVIAFADHGTAEQVTEVAGTVTAPLSVGVTGGGASTDENAPLTLKSLDVTFADAGSDTVDVTLDAGHGTVALGSAAQGVTESGAGTAASPLVLSGTLADIDAALANGVVYTPANGYVGSDAISVSAQDGAFHSNTAMANISVLGPALNSVTLTVSEGGTHVFAPGDFSVAQPQSGDFYSVANVVGGQFEVFNGTNWVAPMNASFTDAQIAAGHVEFVQDGSTTAPNFSITVSDGNNNVSPAIAPTVNFTATDTIADSATYTVDAPFAATVSFADGTGTLDLAQPASFTGQIAGISGTGDVIDIHGFAFGTTAASTGPGSFNSVTDTTTLTVTDSSDHQTETFTLAGDLSGSTWTVTNDQNGGVDIVDPPGTPVAAAPNPAAPASSTIVVSGPNQILTGHAASDSFVFNFAGVGNATVTNFHAATDALQFGSQLFANLQAALNATHDDGHGNTVIALDAHDTITLDGILKAQLHASDFHFV
jgi:hypothetical protein